MSFLKLLKVQSLSAFAFLVILNQTNSKDLPHVTRTSISA